MEWNVKYSQIIATIMFSYIYCSRSCCFSCCIYTNISLSQQNDCGWTTDAKLPIFPLIVYVDFNLITPSHEHFMLVVRLVKGWGWRYWLTGTSYGIINSRHYRLSLSNVNWQNFFIVFDEINSIYRTETNVILTGFACGDNLDEMLLFYETEIFIDLEKYWIEWGAFVFWLGTSCFERPSLNYE